MILEKKIKILTAFIEDEDGNAYMIRIEDEAKAGLMASTLSSVQEAIPIEPIEGINIKVRNTNEYMAVGQIRCPKCNSYIQYHARNTHRHDDGYEYIVCRICSSKVKVNNESDKE